MKKHLFVFLFVIGTVLSGWVHPAGAQEVGRYQIFQAKYTHWDLDTSTPTQNEEIFLLDTTDGNVQIYSSSTKEGKTTKVWTPGIYDEASKTFTITTTTTTSPSE